MTETPKMLKAKRLANTTNVSAYAPTTLTTSNTSSTVYAGDTFALGNDWSAQSGTYIDPQAYQKAVHRAGLRAFEEDIEATRFGAKLPQHPAKEKEVAANKRRIVKVHVIDPDPLMPIDQCVVYTGEEKLTELEDSELFFELNINELLAAHNAKRTKVVDKKQTAISGREVFLEPARVKQLSMAVVEVASF